MAPPLELPAKTAEFRFYEELNDFRAPERRKNAFPIAIVRGRSAKDAIESVVTSTILIYQPNNFV
ncbi:MAG: hypothetical protein WBO23_16445 [Burkholderiales bacterium]